MAAPIEVLAQGSTAAPSAAGTSKEFTFTTPFATIEDFDVFSPILEKQAGILGVSGSERTVTVKWDPGKLTEQQVRDLLGSLGHAVR